MGLAYLFLFGMILGAIGVAVLLLKTAWEVWKRPSLKVLAVIPLLLAAACFAAAFYLLMIVWHEPPWRFLF